MALKTAVVHISFDGSGLPADAPRWLVDLPLVGSHIDDYWHKLVASREEMNDRCVNYGPDAQDRAGRSLALCAGLA